MFAIETELIESYQGRAYGRLRFHVGALPIGDFDDPSDLAASARWGRVLLKASPRRTRPDLEHKTAREILDTLHDRYVSSASDIHADIQADIANWDRDPYLLDDIGDSSLRDKYTVIVIRAQGGTDRLIVRSYNEDIGNLTQITVESGLVDDVVCQYCTWVEALAKDRE